jgi:hypothetical protein
MAEDDVADHSIEDGVAQKLQAFVVDRTPFLIATAYALVQQGLFIIADVVRIETQNMIKSRKKLPLLAEREPDSVYYIKEIITLHTF